MYRVRRRNLQSGYLLKDQVRNAARRLLSVLAVKSRVSSFQLYLAFTDLDPFKQASAKERGW